MIMITIMIMMVIVIVVVIVTVIMIIITAFKNVKIGSASKIKQKINVRIILFANRDFDSFFDTTYTVIGMTRAHTLLLHSSIT